MDENCACEEVRSPPNMPSPIVSPSAMARVSMRGFPQNVAAFTTRSSRFSARNHTAQPYTAKKPSKLMAKPIPYNAESRGTGRAQAQNAAPGTGFKAVGTYQQVTRRWVVHISRLSDRCADSHKMARHHVWNPNLRCNKLCSLRTQ